MNVNFLSFSFANKQMATLVVLSICLSLQQAKKNYESQVARFEQELRETTKVLLQREMEYAKLTSSNTEANDTNETGASSSNAQAFSFKKMFGMKG